MLMKVSWLIRANHALERHCKRSGDLTGSRENISMITSLSLSFEFAGVG
jgi:hypothetical protein